MALEYISTKQARQDLGDKGFYLFCAWLRDKGYINLTQTGEASYKHEIFATKEQLNQFLKEQGRDLKGDVPVANLYGQTREFLKGFKGKNLTKGKK